MSAELDRFRRVAADFTRVVEAVEPERWDDPAPPEGWRARDVVGHLVEWCPALFFEQWGVPAPPIPDVEEDPAGAWRALRDAIESGLADPVLAATERDVLPGRMTFAAAVDQLGTTDVFLHQWDLARATGGDERLDPDEVHALLVGMEPLDEALRASGHFGPRVQVPDDADEQTRLIAFIGRRP